MTCAKKLVMCFPPPNLRKHQNDERNPRRQRTIFAWYTYKKQKAVAVLPVHQPICTTSTWQFLHQQQNSIVADTFSLLDQHTKGRSRPNRHCIDSRKKIKTTMKSIAAVSFSYCVFLGSQEAGAFSRAKIPVGGLVSSAAVSKSSLAASTQQHDATCLCPTCNVGRVAAARREESPVLSRAHGPACLCGSCSQSVWVAHGLGCECGACSQQVRAPRNCGHVGACNC